MNPKLQNCLVHGFAPAIVIVVVVVLFIRGGSSPQLATATIEVPVINVNTLTITNRPTYDVQWNSNFHRLNFGGKASDYTVRHHEWSLVFSNGHDGPFGVYRYGSNGITGLFLIDYSTNRLYTAP